MCDTCGCNDHDHGGSRLLRVERDLLAKNDRHAAANRRWLARRQGFMLNLMASPGAGKTSLLVRTLRDLGDEVAFAVIEGDQQTRLDAERVESCGVPVHQVNTGKGCHLDAHQVGHALTALDPPDGSVVMVENVGNLVCPAGFDLGEQARVVLLSVTEGDDKPLKYPHMFRGADLVILTKTDLLPYVDFDVSRCIGHTRRLHPGVPVIRLSVKSGEGLASWYGWLRAQRRHRSEAVAI